jgi:PAS domain S-box-containing protein
MCRPKGLQYKSAKKMWQAVHSRHWPAGIMLAVGLLITVLTTLAMKTMVETEARQELAVVGHEIVAKIQARLHAYAQILRSGSAYLELTNPVTREQWQAFIAHNEISHNLPGVQGVGFAQLIPPDQLTQHIAAIRAQGFPHYRVWPEGERPVYSAIIYLEPFAGRNLRAFGYDMLSEPVRRAAMEQARDQDVAALSGRVHLVQETDQDIQAGSLMYIAVYRADLPTDTLDQRRAALIGWVYSPYRMNDLMHGILGAWDQNGHDSLRLTVHDGDQTTLETLLYDSQPAAPPPQTAPGLPGSLEMPIDFNGHRWTLRLTPPGAQRATLTDFRVWLVAGSGTLISGLISLLILGLIQSYAQAGQLATELLARRQAETALRAAERKYRDIFQTSQVGIYQTTPTGRYLEVNPAFAHILGFATPEQIMAEIADIGAQLYVNPQDRVALARQVAEQGKVQGFESQARRRDGQICWASIDAMGIRDDNGAIYLYQGTMTDITARKLAEEKLRITLYRLETLISNLYAGILLVSSDGRVEFANQAFCDLFALAEPPERLRGVTTGEMLQKIQRVYVHPAQALARIQYLVAQGQSVKAEEVEIQGGRLYLRDFIPIFIEGQGYGRLWHHVDITERKQIEVALRETHELLSLFIKNSPVCAYIKEVTPTESRVLKASDSFQDMIGIPGSEMVGKTMAELFPAEFAAKITADDWAVISGGQLLERDENLDGRDYITLKFPITQGGKKLLAGYTVDITRRKQAEDALRQSEARFRSYFELPLAGRAITSPSAGWIDVNAALCEMLGYTKAELLQMTWVKLTHPDDLAAESAQFERVMAGEIDGYALEKRFIHRDGHSVYTHLAVHCLRHPDQSVDYFVALILNITERKQAEEKLHLAASVFTHAREGI